MATATDPTSDVEDWLVDVLDRVIGWLQFAESKNIGMVGLISTFLVLIVTFLVAGPSVPTLAGVGLAVCALTLITGSNNRWCLGTPGSKLWAGSQHQARPDLIHAAACPLD